MIMQFSEEREVRALNRNSLSQKVLIFLFVQNDITLDFREPLYKKMILLALFYLKRHILISTWCFNTKYVPKTILIGVVTHPNQENIYLNMKKSVPNNLGKRFRPPSQLTGHFL